MRIIAATQNKHKLSEIEAITSKFDMQLISMADAGLADLEIEETGSTCSENSLIKAKTVCDITGEPAIADDTGLMVDFLDGAPGVYSARFSGVHGDDEAAMDKILSLMKDVPDEERTAKFICAITMVYPDGRQIAVQGYCHGHILHEKRGTEGFGYDKIFMPDGYDKSFGELGQEIKNVIGHRARALVLLNEELQKQH